MKNYEHEFPNLHNYVKNNTFIDYDYMEGQGTNNNYISNFYSQDFTIGMKRERIDSDEINYDMYLNQKKNFHSTQVFGYGMKD